MDVCVLIIIRCVDNRDISSNLILILFYYFDCLMLCLNVEWMKQLSILLFAYCRACVAQLPAVKWSVCVPAGYMASNVLNATSASARTTSWWGPAPRSTTSSVSAAWPAVGSWSRGTSSPCGRTDSSAGPTTTWWNERVWLLETHSVRSTPPDRCRWQVKSREGLLGDVKWFL